MLTFPSVLVTGGTGFLGRRLVERLLECSRNVTVLGRTPAPDLEERGVRFIRASLEDADAMRAACAGMETVFHVAAKVGVWGRYDDFFRANVLGTRALLEGCRLHGVPRFIFTSSPSVVYDGRAFAGANESLPLTTACPSPYPLTKAIAEREVIAANSPGLQTVALRPHLIWGVGDPHLIPRILARARAGRLSIVGSRYTRVDMVHVENVVDAHLLAEDALATVNSASYKATTHKDTSPAGRAYFVTNHEPVEIWHWINDLLDALGELPIRSEMTLEVAHAIGVVYEQLWRWLPLRGEPPLTRFVAFQLGKDHWFDGSAAERDLGYRPRVSMKAGKAELIEHLKRSAAALPRTKR